jgi:hypothetical protein
VAKTRAFCLKMENKLVTEVTRYYYKGWTIDFVKVTSKTFFIFKKILFQSTIHLQYFTLTVLHT